MNGDTSAPAFDLRAIGTGALWGLGIMLLGSVAQGMIGFSSPLVPTTENVMALLWQVIGAVVAGFTSARKAEGTGWLHGALAGAAVVGATAIFMGVVADLPNIGVLLKTFSIGTGVGLAGGVAGVNSSK